MPLFLGLDTSNYTTSAALFDSDGGAVLSRKKLLSVNIEPEAVDPDDVEMLEDLILTAVNEAIAKVDEANNSKMSKLTGGMNIPGLF